MKTFVFLLASCWMLLGCSAQSSGQVATKSKPSNNTAADKQATLDDWAQFRGPGGQGRSEVKGLPLTWGPTDNIAWKAELPGAGASSPIVFGDHIYLTSYTGYFVPGQPDSSIDQLKRHLIAVQRSDGSILWNQEIAAKLPEESQIRDHGFAANTPAADAERVYVFFGKSGVFAFDHSGKQTWQADVGSKTNGWGTSASPVLYKDLVFINASVESESLIALDKTTGKEKWRTSEIKESWNTPTIVTSAAGRSELVIATQGSVKAFDPDTGKPLWTCQTDIGWYMVPSIVTNEDIVYCLGGRSGTAALAVRTGGSGEVTQTHRLWTGKKGSNVSSPVFYDGHLYWANEQRETAYCAKAESGEIVYEERLDRADQIYSSALLADGRIYYLTRAGKTFVVAAKPQFELLATNVLEDRSVFNSSPVPMAKQLLIRSDRFLYCIGEK